MNEYSAPTFLSNTALRGSKGEVVGSYRCFCGTEFQALKCEVRRGRKKSCGCLQRGEWVRRRVRTHGESLYGGNGTSREYRIWLGMKQRCGDPTVPAYKNYGGKGITVCARWVHSYETFLSDMGRSPSKEHSLNRKDNSKGYSPENCEWATWVEQANNRSNNRHLTIAGETHTLAEWCRIKNARYGLVHLRLADGWDPLAALSLPSTPHSMRNKIIVPREASADTEATPALSIL